MADIRHCSGKPWTQELENPRFFGKKVFRFFRFLGFVYKETGHNIKTSYIHHAVWTTWRQNSKKNHHKNTV